MKKDSTIISIFSIVFIIVLIITVVFILKNTRQDTEIKTPVEFQQDIISSITPAITPELIITDNTHGIYLLEIEYTKVNKYADIYLTNSKNISAVEFTIKLPNDIKEVTLTDKDLFYDFVYAHNSNELKIGALSLQVVSPKERYKFVRLNFDNSINKDLDLSVQTFFDQQGNEILK